MNSHQPSPDKSPPVLRTAAQSALPFGIEQILAMPIQQRANASSTQEQIGLAGQSSQIFPYVMAYMLSSIHQQQQQQQQQQLQAAVAAAAGLHRSPANLLSCLSAHRLPQPSQQQLQQQQSQLHQRLHQMHQLPAQRQPFNIQHNSHLHLQQQMFNKVDHGHQQRSMHQLPVQREPVNLQNNQIDMEIDLRGNEEVQAEKLDNLKPAHSYIGLIGMCILSSPEKRMVLNDIYQFILDNYPYYRNRGSGWRNSVRHNLSLNECFQKAGRAANGKGHYWTIHPANMEDFMLGDFRRRRAQRKVRRWNNMDVPSDESDDESMEDASKPPLPEHFKRSLEMHRRLELSQYRQEQI